MDTTHAELIEDLSADACWRLLGPAFDRASYRRWMHLREAARAFGNHALAQLEDSLDATRECAEAGRLAFALAASIREARGLTAAVSG